MNQSDVVGLYGSGLTIRQVAAETGLSTYRVRKALLAEGVTFRGSRGAKPSAKVILASYRETQSYTETASALGVSVDYVAKHVRVEGTQRERGGVRRYSIDLQFFGTYTLDACYWAGFTAADGGLVLAKGAHRLQFNLAEKDRAHLDAFKKCAGVGHPVRDVVLSGNREVNLIVSCFEWWSALHERFNVTQRKSLTLQPPPQELQDDEEMCWHFVRGYFDGDGCVHEPRDSQGRIKQIDFASGSRQFIEWIRQFLGSHHKIGATGRIWRLCISGPVLRRVVPLMYVGSTPDTRLARKYERLKHLLSAGCH